MLTKTFTAAPYPGLRPFEAEECDIFFGREKQTDELLAKLQRNRFLAVIGPSGCGKSSLVRAGLIAALETGFMVDAGSRWRVARMRPGDRPLRRLAESLLTPSLLGDRLSQPHAALFLEAALQRGPLGLLEVVAEAGICRDANFLVLVDQFEEIFRFRAQGNPDESDAFVALLLASAAQTNLPIYIIITMRSDFLGDCAVFRELPEAINRSAYLIPRLTREECAAAISGPAKVFDGEVESSLVNRLLNDFGPDPDQLPVLQHALMRMWFRRAESSGDRPERIVLTGADYERLGGLPRALSDHADEVMRELTPKQAGLAKIIFQRLTERGTGKRDTRSPERLSQLAKVAGADVADLIPIVEAFRRAGRNFLTPADGPLTPDTLIDIGHESLIREWDCLAAWVNEEADSAAIYIRLRDTATLWEAGRAGLWSNPDLAGAVGWRERTHPSEAWAGRYGEPQDFAGAMRFLDASEAEHRRRETLARHARERALRRARRVAVTLAAIIVVMLGAFAAYWYGWHREYSTYYDSFTKVHGVPRGITPLTLQQVAHRPVSLRIVQAGRFGRVLRMEAVNDRGELTPRHFVATYLADAEDSLQRREVRWEFLYDDANHVTSEVAYDRYGKRVWAFVYSPTDKGAADVRIAHFVGADGYPRQTKGFGGEFVKLEYGDGGFERTVSYRNAMGGSRAGPDHAFGQRKQYDARGNMIELVSLGPDGRPMVDDAGNSGLRLVIDQWGNAIEQVAIDTDGRVTTVKDGWSIERSGYDANGNVTQGAFFDEHGQPILHTDGYHRYTLVRDERGNVIDVGFWDIAGRPTLSGGCHGLRRAYDSRGNQVMETCIGLDGSPAPNDSGFAILRMKFDERDNTVERAFEDAHGRPAVSDEGYSRVLYKYDERGNVIEKSFLGINGQPAVTKEGFSRVVSAYEDGRDNETGRAYFGANGAPIVIANVDKDAATDHRNLSFARVRRRFDENGRRIYEAYFDVRDQPMIGPNGYAGYRAVYDAAGNRIELGYFGLHDERVLSHDKYAGWRAGFDAYGRETRVEFFGLRAEPIVNGEKVSGWTSKYDARGKETERIFFGLDGRPTMYSGGYAGERTEYDNRGEASAETYLGLDLALKLRPWDPSRPADGGYARQTVRRDARNRILVHEYFGVTGERVRTPQGWARVVNHYDMDGKEPVETSYFDVDGKPTTMPSGYHSVHQRLDVFGRVVEVSYYDAHGEMVRTSDGFARETRRRDDHGRILEESFFDKDGSPVALNGVHTYINKYDDRGQLLETRYFDSSDRPTQIAGRFQHLTRYSYDERGQVIQILNFDVAGNPAIGRSKDNKGCSRWTGKYDDAGALLTSRCDTDLGYRRGTS